MPTTINQFKFKPNEKCFIARISDTLKRKKNILLKCLILVRISLVAH